VQRASKLRIEGLVPDETIKERALAAREHEVAPYFHAVLAPCKATGDEACLLGQAAATHLGLAAGDSVWMLPLE
jgi:hypothetical protein